jgi:hypothetical protein
MFDIVPLPETLSWSPTTTPSIRQLSWIQMDTPIANELSYSRKASSIEVDESLDPFSVPATMDGTDATPDTLLDQPPKTEVADLSPGCHDMLSNRPRPRRGHKKSRLGCYNCKKRKIKVPPAPKRHRARY